MGVIVSIELSDTAIEQVANQAARYNNGWKDAVDYDGVSGITTIVTNPGYAESYGLEEKYVLTTYMVKRGFERIITGETPVQSASEVNITKAARTGKVPRVMDDQDSDYLLQAAAFGERKFG